MEMTEVDIATGMKGLNSKNRNKLYFYCSCILFTSLLIGSTFEYLIIRNLKNEIHLFKIEVQSFHHRFNNTDGAISHAVAQTVNAKKEISLELKNITDSMTAMNISMRNAQQTVDVFDFNTSSLVGNICAANVIMKRKIKKYIEENENLHNQSYFLSEILKIPNKQVESLKSDVENVHQKLNSIDNTISSLMKNTSDMRNEMKKAIQKQEIMKAQMYSMDRVLDDWIISTKAEMNTMERETRSQRINFTESIRALEQRMLYSENSVNYINQVFINWRLMEILELTNLTEGLELLKIKNHTHKMVVRNIARANGVRVQGVPEHMQSSPRNSSRSILEPIKVFKDSNSSFGSLDQHMKLELGKRNDSGVEMTTRD